MVLTHILNVKSFKFEFSISNFNNTNREKKIYKKKKKITKYATKGSKDKITY